MLLVLIIFVILLVMGIQMDELNWLQVGLYLLLAAGAFLVVGACQWSGTVFFSVIAAMDIVLVITIFKGDIRIT